MIIPGDRANAKFRDSEDSAYVAHDCSPHCSCSFVHACSFVHEKFPMNIHEQISILGRQYFQKIC